MELQGQALAPPGPAAVDDGLAAVGSHADEKAVSAFSSEIMGLERSFHD
jgi:hypothetical protein